MTGILQGFMNQAPVRVANQGRGPWPKWPRRVGARTRPGYQKRMLAFTARQHKSAVSDACKAARQTCKDSVVPAARIYQNPHTASTPDTYHVESLGSISFPHGTDSPLRTSIEVTQSAHVARFCKACRTHHDKQLQDQPARPACKGPGGVST